MNMQTHVNEVLEQEPGTYSVISYDKEIKVKMKSTGVLE